MITKEFLLDMCKLSLLTYKNSSDLKGRFDDQFEFENNKGDDNVLRKCKVCPSHLESDLSEEPSIIQNDCQGYSYLYEDSLVISFRGTESFRDVLSDLNMIRVPMDLTKVANKNRPMVHWGFLKQFRSIDLQIQAYFKTYLFQNSGIKNIIFCGHSLGGAIATLASLKYALEYPKESIHCVTFGSPRVGDKAFVALFDQNVKESARFVNEDDPVTMGPTAWRFKHVRGGRWIEDEKILKIRPVVRELIFFKNLFLSFIGRTHNPISDHSCKSYLENLQKA